MERHYIGVNFPNLISVAIMTGVIVAIFCAVRKFGVGKTAEAAA